MPSRLLLRQHSQLWL
ncbi:polymerase (DNA directed), delta 2, regulatory subunit, isoform CRA_d [Rattus norvegicus]|uniref:Polymerase (DNA directed), delta 2, regulatory subunit, isoform CRA_d n=1 Tax=Rattus norvegicus TaxID=10116 RepID=A6IKQ6_RAT|nr:polymerase (DNA directed), delta 2, regulatory subunit, isoform CRA_d [Rattus norvegicus]